MKYSIKYKNVFNKDNHIVGISSITPENKESEYYSIGTHTPMIAVLGENNQHHFRAKRGYVINPETELHKYAKTILKYRFDTEEKFPIKYYRKGICPFDKKCIFYDEQNGGCEMLEERLFEYDLKKFYDTATIEGDFDGFTADVLLTSSSIKRRPVFLEVVITHPCELKKIASGHKIIEVLVEKEDDAYCKLEESPQYCNEKVSIKFHNFDTKNILKECSHYVGEKKYHLQPPIVVNMRIPTKFYCCPHPDPGISLPLQAYYDNIEIGVLFASNTFAKPFVFDKAMSLDKKNLVIMGKDIYGAVKSWVVYIVSWNGKYYHYKVQSHSDYQSALKGFTLAQGKEWHGGDTLSDLC